MKKLLVFSTLLMCAVLSLAQKIDGSKVPLAVKNAFSIRCPKVTGQKWEKESNNYEANFLDNGQKTSATFDAGGTWLETEHPIDINKLPTAAITYITQHYSGKKIKDAALLNMANGTDNYEAGINGKDIMFDSNGKFIRAAKN